MRCDPEHVKARLATGALARHAGRPKVTSGEVGALFARSCTPTGACDIDDIRKTLRISRSTFYRYVRL